MNSDTHSQEAEKLRVSMLLARNEYFQVSQQIDDVCSQILNRTHGMVTPDGVTALNHLSKRQGVAFQRYRAAQSAYSSFALRNHGGPYPGLLGRPSPSSKPQVTDRELEVLVRLAEGKTTKQIGRELGIAFKTAMTHRTHLLQKFDANNVALLIRKAILHGFIQP